uniref:CW domain-containing protein n=1 Tax=Caenorhabditis tropicalis TaxID=1561998 RepID=A0A1I7UV78_9PELO
MMLIYGEPIGSVQPFQQFDTSWEQCYSDCYDTDNCLIAHHYQSQCKLYEFGTLSIKKISSSADGKRIGIKRSFPEDKCPINMTASTDVWSEDGKVYRNSFSGSGSTWNLNYTVSKCASDSRLFQRSSDIFLCLGLIYFPSSNQCQNYTQASSYCKNNNWRSITAPANEEELDYFIAMRTTSTNNKNPIWVDGMNNIFEDPTHGGYNQSMICPDNNAAIMMSTNSVIVGDQWYVRSLQS